MPDVFVNTAEFLPTSMASFIFVVAPRRLEKRIRQEYEDIKELNPKVWLSETGYSGRTPGAFSRLCCLQIVVV